MITKEIDCFDLEQTAESGQCFRWRKLDNNKYLIPAYGRCVTVSQAGNRFEMSCDEEEFEKVWSYYFDLQTKMFVFGVDKANIIAYNSNVKI